MAGDEGPLVDLLSVMRTDNGLGRRGKFTVEAEEVAVPRSLAHATWLAVDAAGGFIVAGLAVQGQPYLVLWDDRSTAIAGARTGKTWGARAGEQIIRVRLSSQGKFVVVATTHHRVVVVPIAAESNALSRINTIVLQHSHHKTSIRDVCWGYKGVYSADESGIVCEFNWKASLAPNVVCDAREPIVQLTASSFLDSDAARRATSTHLLICGTTRVLLVDLETGGIMTVRSLVATLRTREVPYAGGCFHWDSGNIVVSGDDNTLSMAPPPTALGVQPVAFTQTVSCDDYAPLSARARGSTGIAAGAAASRGSLGMATGGGKQVGANARTGHGGVLGAIRGGNIAKFQKDRNILTVYNEEATAVVAEYLLHEMVADIAFTLRGEVLVLLRSTRLLRLHAVPYTPRDWAKSTLAHLPLSPAKLGRVENDLSAGKEMVSAALFNTFTSVTGAAKSLSKWTATVPKAANAAATGEISPGRLREYFTTGNGGTPRRAGAALAARTAAVTVCATSALAMVATLVVGMGAAYYNTCGCPSAAELATPAVCEGGSADANANHDATAGTAVDDVDDTSSEATTSPKAGARHASPSPRGARAKRAAAAAAAGRAHAGALATAPAASNSLPNSHRSANSSGLTPGTSAPASPRAGGGGCDGYVCVGGGTTRGPQWRVVRDDGVPEGTEGDDGHAPDAHELVSLMLPATGASLLRGRRSSTHKPRRSLRGGRVSGTAVRARSADAPCAGGDAGDTALPRVATAITMATPAGDGVDGDDAGRGRVGGDDASKRVIVDGDADAAEDGRGNEEGAQADADSAARRRRRRPRGSSARARARDGTPPRSKYRAPKEMIELSGPPPQRAAVPNASALHIIVEGDPARADPATRGQDDAAAIVQEYFESLAAKNAARHSGAAAAAELDAIHVMPTFFHPPDGGAGGSGIPQPCHIETRGPPGHTDPHDRAPPHTAIAKRRSVTGEGLTTNALVKVNAAAAADDAAISTGEGSPVETVYVEKYKETASKVGARIDAICRERFIFVRHRDTKTAAVASSVIVAVAWYAESMQRRHRDAAKTAAFAAALADAAWVATVMEEVHYRRGVQEACEAAMREVLRRVRFEIDDIEHAAQVRAELANEMRQERMLQQLQQQGAASPGAGDASGDTPDVDALGDGADADDHDSDNNESTAPSATSSRRLSVHGQQRELVLRAWRDATYLATTAAALALAVATHVHKGVQQRATLTSALMQWAGSLIYECTAATSSPQRRVADRQRAAGQQVPASVHVGPPPPMASSSMPSNDELKALVPDEIWACISENTRMRIAFAAKIQETCVPMREEHQVELAALPLSEGHHSLYEWQRRAPAFGGLLWGSTWDAALQDGDYGPWTDMTGEAVKRNPVDHPDVLPNPSLVWDGPWKQGPWRFYDGEKWEHDLGMMSYLRRRPWHRAWCCPRAAEQREELLQAQEAALQEATHRIVAGLLHQFHMVDDEAVAAVAAVELLQPA